MMMTTEDRPTILAISGRKGSGKSTLAKRIVSTTNEAGGWAWRFSLADPVKRFAADLLGLSYAQINGTDEEKNEPVAHLLWENFPVPRAIKGRRGPMTGREVIQHYATEIFRAHHPEVFVDRVVESIDAFASLHPHSIAVIDDVRFRTEVIALKEQGARILRLTRSPHSDWHASETDLNGYGRFDCTIANDGLTPEECWEAAQPFLYGWKFLSDGNNNSECKDFGLQN